MNKSAQVKEERPDVRMLPVAEVDVHRHIGRKVTEKSPGIEELAANIRHAGGVLQPVIVRPAKDGYELLAGTRRLMAAKMAGFGKIKAEIVRADDARARFITVTENLQREDLSPLEEAAELKALLRGGRDAKEMAAQLGRPVSWVLRRARLMELIPDWRKALEGKPPEKTGKKRPYFNHDQFSRWSVAHMELIARYPAEAQKELLEKFIADSWLGGSWSATQLGKWLAERDHLLRKAPWKPEDESLVPTVGSCTGCPKRSSLTPGLFDDELDPGRIAANDRCLDLGCWEKKAAAHVERRISKLREEHPGLVKISDNWGSRDDVVGTSGYEHTKKTSPGARPAVVVSGRGVGELRWVKLTGDGRKTRAARERDSKGKPKPLSREERYRSLDDRRNAYIVKTVGEILQDAKDERNKPGFCAGMRPEKRVQAMAAMAATFGVEPTYQYSKYDKLDGGGWRKFRKLVESGEQEVVDAVWEGMRETLHERLAFWDSKGAAEKIGEAKCICEVLDLPFAVLRAEAEKEIPVPRAWAKLDATKGARKGKKSEGGKKRGKARAKPKTRSSAR